MAAPSQFLKLRDKSQPLQSRQADNIDATVRPVATAVNKTPIGGAAPPSWTRPSKYSQDFADVSTVLQTAFHQDALGYVWLRLYATTPGGVGAGSEVFVLDSGFWPKVAAQPIGFNGTTNAIVPLNISSTGSVTTAVAVGAGQSIRGYVSFLAGA